VYTSRLDAPVVSSETDIIILYYNGIERTVVTKNKYALSARRGIIQYFNTYILQRKHGNDLDKTLEYSTMFNKSFYEIRRIFCANTIKRNGNVKVVTFMN